MGSLLPYLTGPLAGLVAVLVVAYMFQAGKWHSDHEFNSVCEQRDEYKKALDTERQAVNEYARTGNTSNQLIGALIQVATGRRPPDDPPSPASPVGGG